MRMKKLTKKSLLRIIRNKAIELNRTPVIRELIKYSYIIRKEFGSYNNALKQSELKLNKRSYRQINKVDFINQLKEDFNGKDCINKYELYPYNNIIKKLNTTKKELVTAAGFDYKERVIKSYSKNKLIEIVKEKAKELGRVPVQRDMTEYYNNILKEFGTWNNALKKVGFVLNRTYYKINTKEDLKAYLNDIEVDFLIQEFVNHPLELGVFYYRFPNEENGKVSSIVAKEMLYVEGDGKSTIKKLIENKPRARFQLDTLLEDYDEAFLNQVLPTGEKVELVSIGNHCKGTKFLDGTNWIDERLNQAIDQLAKEIPDYYFGRFDLRCESIDELKELKNFKIMELNGAGAEPAHIYQPGYSLLKAYRSIYHHIRVLSKISALNKKRGFPYWSTKKGLAKIKEIKAYNRQKSS